MNGRIETKSGKAMIPSRLLPLALAVLLSQTAGAAGGDPPPSAKRPYVYVPPYEYEPETQAERAHRRRRFAMMYHVNRHLFKLARENAPQDILVTTNYPYQSFDVPRSLAWSIVAIASVGTASAIAGMSIPLMTASTITSLLALGKPALIGAGIVTGATWGSYLLLEEDPMAIDDLVVQANDSVFDFINNRVEMPYLLVDGSGRSRRGYCLAFFDRRTDPDRGPGIHYALDECFHDDVFPQLVPTEPGDLRIGPDGVDSWDRLLGQDVVVAKGFIPLDSLAGEPKNHRRPPRVPEELLWSNFRNGHEPMTEAEWARIREMATNYALSYEHEFVLQNVSINRPAYGPMTTTERARRKRMLFEAALKAVLKRVRQNRGLSPNPEGRDEP